MNITPSSPRFLGATFVLVFLASLIGGVLQANALGITPLTGSDAMSAMLAHLAANLTLFRIGILLDLVNILGILTLAALLYLNLRRHAPTFALIALGWWWAEGIVLAVSKLGAYALIPLSQQVSTTVDPSTVVTLAETLYFGIDRVGNTLHMLFFCLGALIWYALLFQVRLVPRWLSGWGWLGILLITIGTLLQTYDPALDAPIALYILYIPFELVFGLWLLFRGFSIPATHPPAVQPATALT